MTPAREKRIKEVLTRRQKGLVVVLEDIHDPHNAAAIMRTCDAFGVGEVWLVFDKEKSYNPKRVGKSSSSSANKWLTFRKFKGAGECLDELRKEKYFIVATGLRGKTKDIFSAELSKRKIALIVGNEHRGVSEAFLEEADSVVTIPMRGFVESLNVSVATALFIYEITRARGAH